MICQYERMGNRGGETIWGSFYFSTGCCMIPSHRWMPSVKK